MKESLAIAAAAWSVAMAAAPLLQIRSMIRRRSSREISVAYFAVLVVGFALWIAYGVALHNRALIVANAASLAAGASTIAVALWFRRPGHDGAQSHVELRTSGTGRGGEGRT